MLVMQLHRQLLNLKVNALIFIIIITFNFNFNFRPSMYIYDIVLYTRAYVESPQPILANATTPGQNSNIT